MNERCKHISKDGFRCGSYAFNLYKDDVDQGDLCDVHYWQTKAQPEQKRPQNCGTGYCSCIECVMEPEQEPVADDFFRMIADRNPKPFPLPQRTWVGLTDEEIDYIYTGVRAVHHEIDSDVFARAIEAKLKDKNT